MYQDFFRLQGIKVFWSRSVVKATVSGVFQDITYKISEGSDQFSWDSHQGRLRTTSISFQAVGNFKLKVLKYSRNCSLHNTLILNLVEPLNVYVYNIQGKFKPHYGNQDFSPFDQWDFLYSNHAEKPLRNGNSPITKPIIEIGVAYALELYCLSKCK